MNNLTLELDKLINQDIEQVLCTQRSYWSLATKAAGDNIVLFGAGALGQHILTRMRNSGMAAPIAFADNASDTVKEVDGIPVLSPRDAVARYGKTSVFVIAIYNSSMPRKQLTDLGASVIVHFAWFFASNSEAFLPHDCLDLPSPIFEQATDVRRGFELMADDQMKRVYLAQLRCRLFLDFDRAINSQTPALRESEYFPDDIYSFLPNEVLIDCGAFQGDTIQRFLAKRGDSFEKIYACEPDLRNRIQLSRMVASLPKSQCAKISVEAFAVGAKSGKERFTNDGSVGSHLNINGPIEVDIATIDEITKQVPPTLIKMDIEGAELEALAGAKKTIEKHTPVLAICIYHASDHLWRVPLLVHSMSSRYRFYLRAHAEDCWDVSCYAVPVARDMKK